MSEEAKDRLQDAIDALDDILNMDEGNVPSDVWDEVNDLYHRLEDIPY